MTRHIFGSPSNSFEGKVDGQLTAEHFASININENVSSLTSTLIITNAIAGFYVTILDQYTTSQTQGIYEVRLPWVASFFDVYVVIRKPVLLPIYEHLDLSAQSQLCIICFFALICIFICDDIIWMCFNGLYAVLNISDLTLINYWHFPSNNIITIWCTY